MRICPHALFESASQCLCCMVPQSNTLPPLSTSPTPSWFSVSTHPTTLPFHSPYHHPPYPPYTLIYLTDLTSLTTSHYPSALHSPYSVQKSTINHGYLAPHPHHRSLPLSKTTQALHVLASHFEGGRRYHHSSDAGFHDFYFRNICG